MSLCASMAISRSMLLTKRDLDWNIYEDVAKDCVRVLATTKPVESTRFIKREGYEATPCAWTNSWWARAIKWCLRKKYIHRIIPHPLECLVFATEVSTKNQIMEWPEAVSSLITAQVAQIRMQGNEPKLIAIGYSKRDELLMDAFHFSTMPIMRSDEGHAASFRGIPVVVTQKLTHNSVLVL